MRSVLFFLFGFVCLYFVINALYNYFIIGGVASAIGCAIIRIFIWFYLFNICLFCFILMWGDLHAPMARVDDNFPMNPEADYVGKMKDAAADISGKVADLFSKKKEKRTKTGEFRGPRNVRNSNINLGNDVIDESND
jgi:hypothetical protein